MKRVMLIICIVGFIVCLMTFIGSRIDDEHVRESPNASNKPDASAILRRITKEREERDQEKQYLEDKQQKEIRRQIAKENEEREREWKRREREWKEPTPIPYKREAPSNPIIDEGLRDGIFHSITPALNEVRMDPLVWSLLPIESKWATIELFEQYFKSHPDSGLALCYILSKYNDDKLGTTGFWGGYKVYK